MPRSIDRWNSGSRVPLKRFIQANNEIARQIEREKQEPLLQDQSLPLTEWMASKPDARQNAREAARAILRLRQGGRK